MTQTATFTALIHGESGVGKSVLADTTPPPRLILDAEGGSEYTPSWPKQIWNPNYAPPGMQGCAPGQEQCAETVRVLVQDWATWTRVMYWLTNGFHPFISVVMDSLTEIQKRCRDNIAGTDKMQTQDWGTLLIEMETAIRRLRDMAKSEHFLLKNVIFLALVDEKKGRGRPFVQGALQQALPGFVDLVAYQYTEPMADGMTLAHKILIQPYGQFVAKDRTHILSRTFGPVITIRDIDRPDLGGYTLGDMVSVLDGRHQTTPQQHFNGGTING